MVQAVIVKDFVLNGLIMLGGLERIQPSANYRGVLVKQLYGKWLLELCVLPPPCKCKPSIIVWFSS